MADAAAARREARRKRILENSQNRLQRISGKCTDEFLNESPRRVPVPDLFLENPSVPEEILTHPSILGNGILTNESELFGLLQNHDLAASGDSEETHGSSLDLHEPEKQKSVLETLVAYKYDVVLLSILFQLLHSFSLFTFDNGYFFIPLITYVATKVIWFPEEQKSGIANIFMLMNGMSVDKVQKILNMMQLGNVFLQDVSIYLFTTICIQSLIITMKEYLIT